MNRHNILCYSFFLIFTKNTFIILKHNFLLKKKVSWDQCRCVKRGEPQKWLNTNFDTLWHVAFERGILSNKSKFAPKEKSSLFFSKNGDGIFISICSWNFKVDFTLWKLFSDFFSFQNVDSSLSRVVRYKSKVIGL